MSTGQRLALSLALSVGIGVGIYAVTERWRVAPPRLPVRPEVGAEGRQARIERLRTVIEAHRAALRQARQQHGDATAELDRLDEELAILREEIGSLHGHLDDGEDRGVSD